ncbi:hypothetical protein L2E82_01286 [Cichorium intybus]|uniref:Uncharacterized protein n=1 Tax=Cichorium intybus TaxID=13427 RepID=A0ACB9GZA0_CICIN|nr:hypothetical protein L2E82_01286 [Cichorium intybus]
MIWANNKPQFIAHLVKQQVLNRRIRPIEDDRSDVERVKIEGVIMINIKGEEIETGMMIGNEMVRETETVMAKAVSQPSRPICKIHLKKHRKQENSPVHSRGRGSPK